MGAPREPRPRALSMTWVVVVLGLLLATGATAADGLGRVEVRVTDHRAGIADFAALHVELAEVALHPRGQPRGQGWVTAVVRTPAVDLVPLKDGRWARVGEAAVPAGRYDAVRVWFGPVRGALRNGLAPELRPIGSTVALDLAVEPNGLAAVLVDLYVEDVSDHEPGHYLVKIKAVRAS
ncbi:MAG: DUF4382 domain-containing protein [Gemmatimonadales bacterium]